MVSIVYIMGIHKLILVMWWATVLSVPFSFIWVSSRHRVETAGDNGQRHVLAMADKLISKLGGLKGFLKKKHKHHHLGSYSLLKLSLRWCFIGPRARGGSLRGLSAAGLIQCRTIPHWVLMMNLHVFFWDFPWLFSMVLLSSPPFLGIFPWFYHGFPWFSMVFPGFPWFLPWKSRGFFSSFS